MTAKWAGRPVTQARAHWRPRLPLPCRRCGKPVLPTPDTGWQVGHIVDRALGGAHDISNQWPEHKRCNLSAGGKLGAAITNARRATTPRPGGMTPPRDRGIRGI